MKTQQEIEKLAFDYAYQFRDNDIKIQDANHNGFVEGYSKCQQDNADNMVKDLVAFIKYYKSTAEMSALSSGENLDLSIENIAEKFIQSLNKQE
jgi:maltodextrin utilization protein YvdJ